MRDEVQQTPLIIAVNHNRLSMVELFINQGADVSLCNAYGQNVFHYCTGYVSREEVLSLLLPHADANTINKCDNNNRTPLWYAFWDGRLKSVRLILSRNDVNISESAWDYGCSLDLNRENMEEIKCLIRDYKK